MADPLTAEEREVLDNIIVEAGQVRVRHNGLRRLHALLAARARLDALEAENAAMREQLRRTQDLLIETVDDLVGLKAENAALKQGLLVAAQIADEINGVDLHDEAYNQAVKRVGGDMNVEPTDEDYVAAFLVAVEARRLVEGG